MLAHIKESSEVCAHLLNVVLGCGDADCARDLRSARRFHEWLDRCTTMPTVNLWSNKPIREVQDGAMLKELTTAASNRRDMRGA